MATSNRSTTAAPQATPRVQDWALEFVAWLGDSAKTVEQAYREAVKTLEIQTGTELGYTDQVRVGMAIARAWNARAESGPLAIERGGEVVGVIARDRAAIDDAIQAQPLALRRAS